MRAQDLKNNETLIVKKERDVFKMHIKEATKETIYFRNVDIDSSYQRITKSLFDITFLIIEKL